MANATATAAAPTAKPKLYALLVGIDKYQGEVILAKCVTFPPLHGCVADATRVQAYLQQEDSFELHLKLLTNQKATKAEVVRQLQTHLSQAQAGDVALFYYSGHGAQEWADSAWASETDGKLESLACYYDELTKEEFLLADKELRYLLNQVAANQPHIVTIFDCCHSADVTRNGALVSSTYQQTIEKRLPFVFPKRPWKAFIFADKLSREQLLASTEAQLLPEGRHIQLSACESDESAVEVAGEGVFTKALLDVLRQAQGEVTYHALQSRVRQYLKSVYEQKPRFYTPDGDQSLLYSVFLNKSGPGSLAFGEVTFNPKIGWQLNLGALHGIDDKTKRIQVLDRATQQSVWAQVVAILIDSTELALETPLDTAQVYQGYVEGMLTQDLLVHFHNDNGLLAEQKTLLDSVLSSSTDVIIPEENEALAQYVVRTRNNHYYITRPHQLYQPLAAPVPTGDAEAPLVLGRYLKHLSRWEYIKNIANHDAQSTLAPNAIKVDLYRVLNNGERISVDLAGGIFELDYEFSDNKWKSAFEVVLTNTTEVNVYCSSLYLTSSFGSFTDLLRPAVYLLEPGNSVSLSAASGSSTITSTLNEVARIYNWQEQVEYLKVIYSTTLFDVLALSLDRLPAPPTTANRTRGQRYKDLDFAPPGPEARAVEGWTSALITIRQRNPEASTIPASDLKIMLNDPDLLDFALGLYFDGQVDANRQPTYALKPAIVLKNDEDEVQPKGLLQDKVVDIANWWARRRRNQHYQDVIKRFPTRIRLVAEGDSWFEHPLVLDVIDHLSKVYAVYCTAAAGDTLRNYLSEDVKNGEYYLDALDEQKPQFFLISGGGNDILGAQFRTYLVDAPDTSLEEGQQPERFLKQALWNELAALMQIYRTWFGNLLTHKPQVQVVVHGYDYPVKLNDPHKGWLGRYMIEKGIARAGDRKAIIHLIMDRFNEELKQAAEEFSNVTYLDVRNTVRYNPTDGEDQWYDEIHPDDNGFQQVAMKFIEYIDRLYRESARKKTDLNVGAPPPKPAVRKAAPVIGAITRGGNIADWRATASYASTSSSAADKDLGGLLTSTFRDRDSAEEAYQLLSSRGYTKYDVNLLMSDETRKKHFGDDTPHTELGDKAMEGAGVGSAIGSTAGAVIGAIAAIGTSVALPGLGLVVAGPLAAALAGAGAGGLTGGLTGALVGSGIPEEHAVQYEADIKNGGIVLGVKLRNAEDARHVADDFLASGGDRLYPDLVQHEGPGQGAEKGPAGKPEVKFNTAGAIKPASHSEAGQLVYDIADTMQVGMTYRCKVKIADNQIPPIKIGAHSVHEDIRVSDEMSVKLLDSSGGSAFSIASISTERQAIFSKEITSWEFQVRPLEPGMHPLLLKVTMHFQGLNKDLDVLEKEVLVSSGAAAAPESVTRILFLCANPDDTGRLRVAAESEKIKEAIQSGSQRDHYLFTTNMAVTPRTMTQYFLREKPAIVHFSGHGEEEGLILETDNGISKLIDKRAVGMLFSNFKGTVRCVILNACYSEAQAAEIHKHIPYVIGMKGSIKDNVSVAFSIGFYQALVEDKDIVSAFNIGMTSIAFEDIRQKDLPVLLENSALT